MKISFEKAMEIAKAKDLKKMYIDEIVFVGNLDECWEYIRNNTKDKIIKRAYISRLDEVEFDGENWETYRNNRILTDEKGAYWYYVYKMNGRIHD